MATWFSNTTIGLDGNGYGRLLGEAAFTSARVSLLLIKHLRVYNNCFGLVS